LQNQEKICMTIDTTREEVGKKCVLTVGLLQQDTARVSRWINVAPVCGVRGPTPSEVNTGGMECGL
jgi:hypothetical protein